MRPSLKPDSYFMERALQLAALSTRKALPNPSVGAVITYDGTIIGEGYHHEFGGPHAEVHAIQNVRDEGTLRKATLYVTLEPCSHFGKTPPCVDLILSARIPKVVVGCRDPFDLVSGRGIQRLREAGVEVIEGILHDACILQNRRFILAHRLKRPYVILKWAQTEDGYIAPEDRSRCAISCAESLARVHRWRGQEMAIAVGSTTVISDDPLLTVRDVSLYPPYELPAHNPLRIVIGNTSRIPSDARVWNADAATIAFIPNAEKVALPPHVEQICLNNANPLESICHALYSRNILSILIEGGSQTIQRWIDAGLWDEARVFVAPHRLTQGVRAPLITTSPLHELESGVDTLYLYAHPEIPARLGIEQFSFESV